MRHGKARLRVQGRWPALKALALLHCSHLACGPPQPAAGVVCGPGRLGAPVRQPVVWRDAQGDGQHQPKPVHAGQGHRRAGRRRPGGGGEGAGVPRTPCPCIGPLRSVCTRNAAGCGAAGRAGAVPRVQADQAASGQPGRLRAHPVCRLLLALGCQHRGDAEHAGLRHPRQEHPQPAHGAGTCWQSSCLAAAPVNNQHQKQLFQRCRPGRLRHSHRCSARAADTPMCRWTRSRQPWRP